MIVAEYGSEIRVGYLYAAAGIGWLAYAAWHGFKILMDEIQWHREERILRELDRLDSDDLAAGDPPDA